MFYMFLTSFYVFLYSFYMFFIGLYTQTAVSPYRLKNIAKYSKNCKNLQKTQEKTRQFHPRSRLKVAKTG